MSGAKAMPNKPLVVHRLARNEASAAFRWYRRRSPDAAVKFAAAVASAFEAIEKNPDSFPEYLGGTRRCLTKKFPYLVVYYEMPDCLLVVAVAHGRRKPGYWRRRL
ncbi:MAG TPA: type II toxin-antitoxin system RelE/ParE family toxin [Tepidisphaeraceae bacterium]|nr:type II toxin-antitoxin system RelE/ParE family toxin [Tepidisphaeraceae bacterium]